MALHDNKLVLHIQASLGGGLSDRKHSGRAYSCPALSDPAISSVISFPRSRVAPLRRSSSTACVATQTSADVPVPKWYFYWHIEKNSRTWKRAFTRSNYTWQWQEVHQQPEKGFFARAGADGAARALPFGRCPKASDKFKFVEKVSASQELARFVPETHLTYESYVAAASQTSGAETKASPNSTGVCQDLWFFKAALDNNGTGVVTFCGVQSLDDVRLLIEDKRARSHLPSQQTKNCDDEEEKMRGVFQRFIPNLLLWDGHKFDLRVYATLCPMMGEVYMFQDAGIRAAPKPFSADSVTAAVMMTHYSGMKPTSRWPQWSSVKPQVSRAIAATLRAFKSDLIPCTGPSALLWGIDVAVDVNSHPYVLEVNTAPELTYGDKFPQWQGVVDRMLDDFLGFFVVPYLTNTRREEFSQTRGGWELCN